MIKPFDKIDFARALPEDCWTFMLIRASSPGLCM
jgi:hypothetical protein